MQNEICDKDILKILELDDNLASITMDNARSDYEIAINRLNMLLVVCGVVLTISITALTIDWEIQIHTWCCIFSMLVIISTVICIVGLFEVRKFRGMLNPNGDKLRRAKCIKSFYEESIDSKLSVAKSHMGATENVWKFIKCAYVSLIMSMAVLTIIVIELAIS